MGVAPSEGQELIRLTRKPKGNRGHTVKKDQNHVLHYTHLKRLARAYRIKFDECPFDYILFSILFSCAAHTKG